MLLPGAGGAGWYWSYVVPLLHAAGHNAFAVDFPGDDEAAGLPEYTDIAVNAIGDRDDVVVVAQSLGGFTAPLVCARTAVSSLVLINAMIPEPGETPGAWWDNVGAVDARDAAARAQGYPTEFDPFTYFLHDVPDDVATEGEQHQGAEADAVFASTCDFTSWPADLRVLAGADDRFFPLTFQQRVARERLGIEPDVLPGGHLIALAHPDLVTDYLLGS